MAAHFVIRSGPLNDIQRYYQNSKGPAAANVVALLGMGGCGKTQLVLEYCRQAEDEGRFHAIFWIDASSPNTVAQSYTVILEAITKNKVDSNDGAANIRTALKMLSVWKNPWLLVFDNFDDPKAFENKHIREYYPQRGRGFIIFTSRDAESKTLGSTILISNMLENEGLELLFLSSGYKGIRAILLMPKELFTDRII